MKVISNLVLMVSLLTTVSIFSSATAAADKVEGAWGPTTIESQPNTYPTLDRAYSSLQINYGTDLHRILPRNNMRIPVNIESSSNMNEKLFQSVINRIQQFYRIRIYSDWESPEVNAYATGFGVNPYVVILGGLARHPSITPDGLAIVVCHEVGHHLAGAPADDEGASNEGASDYFSTAKCMKTALRGLDNYAVAKNLFLTRKDLANEYAIKACQSVFNNNDEANLCVRVAAGGMSTAQMFHSFEPRNPEPRFDTPSRVVARAMVNDHPETQCRLDTYFQGSLCNVSDKISLSRTDYEGGACTARQGFKVGLRPLCWFNPTRNTRFRYREMQ